MSIALTKTVHQTGRWLGSVLDEWLPPGDAPDNAGDWHPDSAEDYCPRCGASAGQGSVTPRGCAFCVDKSLPWHRFTRLAAYHEPVDEWIRQLKFQRRWRFGEWMGKQLADVLEEPENANNLLVCPVPMHRLRRWRRGFNQADLIARAVVRKKHWTYAPILKRTRHTPPQTSIAPSQRDDNVRRSFAIQPVDLAGRDILLIDDVKTSGATLAACVRLIKKAGARSIHAAVIAVADPKGQGFKAT